MRHLAGVLRDIASAKDVAAGEGRIKPLMALNTIGVGGGGFDKVRGEVIDAMLTVCDDFVSRHDLDLVIGCASASDYAAFQNQRRSHNSFPTLDADLREHGQRLAELARSGELALFLGAGVSMPAGLPSWWTLLVRLDERCGVTEAELLSLDSPLDQAELIVKRLAADGTDLTSAVKREFAGVSVPSLSHVQLAVLGCREVVTTNFDLLYDAALLTRDERLVAGQASAALREIRSLAENAGPASGWRQLQICWKDSGQRLPARRLLERPSVQEVAQAALPRGRPDLAVQRHI